MDRRWVVDHVDLCLRVYSQAGRRRYIAELPKLPRGNSTQSFSLLLLNYELKLVSMEKEL